MTTILTVITPQHLQAWLLNVDKICKLNSNLQDLTIITVCQSGMADEIPQLRRMLIEISRFPEYLFVINQEVTGIPEASRGSYEHALGLATGLRSKEFQGIIYIVDPDFFILQKNWLQSTARYLKHSHSGYAGAMYDPSDVKQWIDFPCLHFFYFKEEKIEEFIQNLMPNLVTIDSKVKVPFRESLEKKLSSSAELGYKLRSIKINKSVFFRFQSYAFFSIIATLATYFKLKSFGRYAFIYRCLIGIGIKYLRQHQKKQGIILVHGTTSRSHKLLNAIQKRVMPTFNFEITNRVLVLEQQAKMDSAKSDFTLNSGIEIYMLDKAPFAYHLRSFRNRFEDFDLIELEKLLLK